MQRLHLEDLTGYLEKLGGWEIISLPAIAEEDEKHFFSDGRVFERKAGEVLLPNREPLEVLEEVRKISSDFNFLAQYQQNPLPEAGNIIDFKNFARYENLPEEGKYIQSWDIAFKTGFNNDYSVCITAKLHENKIYITDIYRKKIDFSHLQFEMLYLNRLAQNCNVIIESTTSTLHLINIIAEAGINIIPFEPKGSKIERANYISMDIACGRVLLLEFPKGKHDDQVDALTQLIARCTFKTQHEKFNEALDLLKDYNKSEKHQQNKLMYWRFGKGWGLL